jgi:hypothetical protein
MGRRGVAWYQNPFTKEGGCMNTVILACETLGKELAAALEKTEKQADILWLPGGEHNVPRQRRAQIQAALETCPEGSTVLLAMTLCGGSLEGLDPGSHRLVVPRCQDCVTLLLEPELRRLHPSTYFLTEGWLHGQRNLEAEYRHSVAVHGEHRARQIFHRMLAHYRYLALVDVDAPAPETETRVRELARVLGLEYGYLQGSTRWLEELLGGVWSPDRFLILQPHTAVTAGLALGFEI